jgi:hypothetical protein
MRFRSKKKQTVGIGKLLTFAAVTSAAAAYFLRARKSRNASEYESSEGVSDEAMNRPNGTARPATTEVPGVDPVSQTHHL